MIFREALATWLEPGEQVEADDGYVGEAPLRVKCLKSMTEPAEKGAMAKQVRLHQVGYLETGLPQ